jgi:hypothetical protein
MKICSVICSLIDWLISWVGVRAREQEGESESERRGRERDFEWEQSTRSKMLFALWRRSLRDLTLSLSISFSCLNESRSENGQERFCISVCVCLWWVRTEAKKKWKERTDYVQQRNQSECARASTIDQAMPAPEGPGEPARHIDTQTIHRPAGMLNKE